MSGLLGLLGLGAGAITAQNAGVAVSGRNTANVNTEGYSQERVDLESIRGVPHVGGVLAGNPQRYADDLLAGRERLSDGTGGRSGALASALGALESSATSSDRIDIAQAIATLFGGITKVAAQPADQGQRTALVGNGRGLASAFQAQAAAITSARQDSDSRVKNLAVQATQLAATIAGANKQLNVSPDPVLEDKRDQAARKLAEITGGNARIDANGKMSFVAAGGVVLVDGDRPTQMRAVMDATTGVSKIEVVDGKHVEDVTTKLDGGKMAGEIAFRDGTSKKAADDLDQLAFDLASKFNAVHRGGAALDGSTGHDFFVQPTQVQGAAAAFAVDAGIDADPRLVAAAGPTGAAGDNTNALALLDLSTQKLAGGGTRTALDEAIHYYTDLGVAASDAQSANELDAAHADVLASLRDSISGVSLDDEVARLAQFQRASEAATKFVGVVNDMLQNLIQNL
jgi:flagellar hook-associated protein 1 FlgK